MSMIQEIQDKALQYFQRYVDLKALFYFDADGLAKEEVLALDLEGIRIAALESNPFTLKYRLANEWKTERVLVYARRTAQRPSCLPAISVVGRDDCRESPGA